MYISKINPMSVFRGIPPRFFKEAFMSFKAWADGQDEKRPGDKTDDDKKPTGVPVPPKPEQAPAQTAPGNDERKAG
jgi:hypothetical protein